MNRRPILIVEDEPDLGKVLLENLSQNGYAVHLPENAEKALKLFNHKSFDLVISDSLVHNTHRHPPAGYEWPSAAG